MNQIKMIANHGENVSFSSSHCFHGKRIVPLHLPFRNFKHASNLAIRIYPSFANDDDKLEIIKKILGHFENQKNGKTMQIFMLH